MGVRRADKQGAAVMTAKHASVWPGCDVQPVGYVPALLYPQNFTGVGGRHPDCPFAVETDSVRIYIAQFGPGTAVFQRAVRFNVKRGQAMAPGYAYQVLKEKYSIQDCDRIVQKSLNFLLTESYRCRMLF